MSIICNIFGFISIFFILLFGLVGFIYTWKFSEFFIPPRDHWSKSAFAVIITKIGIALTGAYFTVIAIAYILSKIGIAILK